MTPKLSGPMLQPVSGTAKQLVVLLHGYGSDGRDLIALGQFWRDTFPDALFIAPNAHEVCPVNPMGYQWFALDLDRDISRLVGSETARPVVRQFLEDLWEQSGLGPAETVLVGFSQGAMMALDTGLRLRTPLKGIVAFSGMIIAPDNLASEIGSNPPVQLIHGDMDEVVPVAGSQAAHPLLTGLGIDSRLYIERGAGHTIAQDGLETATDFLREVMG
ncbi:alpha/beta hydrolase [Pelagibacterium xiamenense]|uniref:alpha/beta hydrolase n=1 Tax=Pelagibacterium xiamenense TaxID=2901140 RepID=UPI001E50C3DD|nr:dienelactone hydrolase family protein [Pelagibacterium xiamenense]MCD7061310.1 dienelactone hydrolase family protein [Pelagibacterium xiamenense]